MLSQKTAIFCAGPDVIFSVLEFLRSCRAAKKGGPNVFWTLLVTFQADFMILGCKYLGICGQPILGIFQILGFPDFQISSSRHSHEYLTYMGSKIAKVNMEGHDLSQTH